MSGHLSLVPSRTDETEDVLETLDHYRPWCRGCGARSGPYLIADEAHEWVQDEDDLGFPFCLSCVTGWQAEHDERMEVKP